MGDLVSWKSGRRMMYGRVEAVNGDTASVILYVEKEWGKKT